MKDLYFCSDLFDSNPLSKLPLDDRFFDLYSPAMKELKDSANTVLTFAKNTMVSNRDPVGSQFRLTSEEFANDRELQRGLLANALCGSRTASAFIKQVIIDRTGTVKILLNNKVEFADAYYDDEPFIGIHATLGNAIVNLYGSDDEDESLRRNWIRQDDYIRRYVLKLYRFITGQ